MGDKVREALELALASVEQNHQWHKDYDDYDGYPGSDLEETTTRALEALRTALAAPPQEQAPGWMPIESAPKDGGGLVDIFTDRRYAGCHWDAICGEYRHIDHSGTLIRLRNAKFWMPAPAAPSQEQAKGRV